MRRPKGIKTKKSVAKRFKITATGKVLRSSAGRRHLCQGKSAKRRRSLRDEYLRRLRGARTRIDIANPYFVPDRAIRVALEQAVARGVLVRLLIPARGDVAMGRLLVQPAVLFAVDADLRRQSRGLAFEPVVNALDHPAAEFTHRIRDAGFEVEHRGRRRPGREVVRRPCRRSQAARG